MDMLALVAICLEIKDNFYKEINYFETILSKKENLPKRFAWKACRKQTSALRKELMKMRKNYYEYNIISDNEFMDMLERIEDAERAFAQIIHANENARSLSLSINNTRSIRF